MNQNEWNCKDGITRIEQAVAWGLEVLAAAAILMVVKIITLFKRV